MKKIFLLPLFFTALLISTTLVQAETQTLQAVADTMIDQKEPDEHFGAAWYAEIRNDPSEYSCYLGRFEDADLPPEVIIDKVTFRFDIYNSYFGEDGVIQIGANDTEPLITDEFPHNTISWSNSPNRLTDYRYTVYFRNNAGHPDLKEIDITKLFNAWQSGEIENNGLYMCVAPSQPRTKFKIFTREKTDVTNAPPVIIISYHTATLGEGEPEEDSSSNATFSFNLISPDNTTLTTPPYTFTWQDTHASDPARQHLTIIVNKKNSDSTTTQVIKDDIPTTWTKYESSVNLDDGKYEWFIQAYEMDTKVYETAHKEFTVDKNASTSSQNSSSNSKSEQGVENSDEKQTEEESSTKATPYLIISIVSGFILLMAVGTSVYVLWKRKRGNQEKKERRDESSKNVSNS